jgi:GNAT superfamily N-acetyltransferase
MRTADIHSVVRLTAEEHWGFGTRDLKRMMALQPSGCLVATLNTAPIGLTTTIAYGKTLGWIGNVVVERRQRGAGVGSRLVQSAVTYLRRINVKSIGLYSYPENETMYERLGFKATDGFATLSIPQSAEDSTRTMGRNLFYKIIRLDNRAFGADRSKLLRRLYREFPKFWTWITNDTGLTGYSLVKQYRDSSEIGPLVSEPMNRDCVRVLLQSSFALTKKWPLEMSVPESNSTAAETAVQLGFRRERKGVVMSYARLKPAVIGPAIGALGFLDKG